ncbi:endonuclease I family protein [Sporosarcina highlanderae]|uniref:endonuclease I family protein n=1 Tax=Sporosarcina highlanderae TaxID=3035916 RepID=UPI0034271E0C
MIKKELKELECMEECDSDVLVAQLTKNQQSIQSKHELYYNQAQDQSWIEHYYCQISFSESKPEKLFKSLHSLVTETHKYKHPYHVSKDQYLYTWVDLQPDGQLRNIYSGVQKDPRIVIEEDFNTVQKRFEQYRKLINKQRYSRKKIRRQVRKVSSQHKFNAEHVVPQSWFRAKEPMKGDLHHLFACEPKCNSIRSNFPYYEFDSKETPVKLHNHCGLYDINRFEPEYGKGPVARATLYFLLRYPTKILIHFKKTINLPLLVQWHEQFPVNDYEKHRNKAIFEIQGNRNPFIDFPDLTKKLKF